MFQTKIILKTFIYLDQMSGSWNMDECGDQMAQGTFLLCFYYNGFFKFFIFIIGLRWRDPNLPEVITFLANPNNLIKANAAAYLQHLCYMDDPNKQKTRTLGGIQALAKLLNHDCPDVYRNACGALRYIFNHIFCLYRTSVQFSFFLEIYHMEDKMMKINEPLKMLVEYHY